MRSKDNLKKKSLGVRPKKKMYFVLKNSYGLSNHAANYYCSLGGYNQGSVENLISSELMRLINRDRIQQSIEEVDIKKRSLSNIEHKIRIRCYQGIRHIQSLPVNGQNTKNNASVAKKLNGKKRKV